MMKSIWKIIFFINLGVVFTLGGIAVLLKSTIGVDIILVGFAISIASLVCMGFVFIAKLFDCQFMESEILLLFGKLVYKRVLYTEIQGITIRGAVDQKGYPIRDKNKRQKAVISGYSSQYSFFTYMRADGISIMPYVHEDDLLFQSYLCEDAINVLLLNTQVPIYVTEDMMNIYKEILYEIFIHSLERIKVACNIEGGNTVQFISFSEYLNN